MDEVNRFIKSPVRVVLYDPIANESRRVYCFLGDVSQQITRAVQRKEKSILREFYGVDYATKLCYDIEDEKRAYTGGCDYCGGEQQPQDLRGGAVDLSDESFSDADIREMLSNEPKKARVGVAAVKIEPGIEYVSNIHVYPEDKFMDLKHKMHILTGIPAYRQHMFYVANGRVATTYTIQNEGIYGVDIRSINKPSINKIFDINVDKYLYESRAHVHINANDTFEILDNTITMDNIIYIVDLAEFIQPRITQLREAIGDSYQFDLFYYGFVMKYWPMLTRECFVDYVRDEGELTSKYPELARVRTAVAQTYMVERDIINTHYKTMARAQVDESISIAITQMMIMMQSARTVINIRNLFDKLETSRYLPEIHAYIEHDNKRYLLRKRHIRNGIDISFPAGQTMKNGITIAISLNARDQETFHHRANTSTYENEQSRYMFLNIWQNGRYYVRVVANEEDELGFESIIKIVKKYTDALIGKINSFGRYIFVAGTALPLCSRSTATYDSLSICIFWKKPLPAYKFNSLREAWNPYTRAGIISSRPSPNLDKFEFVFCKGVYEFNQDTLERVVAAANNVSIGNHYAYLSNSIVKQKWDQNYLGRIVNMVHRTSDIKFEIGDIHEDEFDTFFNYIKVFIALSAPHLNKAPPAVVHKDGVRALKKSREQDPEAYNLKKHGSPIVWSVVCQKQRQPVVYSQEEIAGMSAGDVKKLTQYWNFTLNKPAWYGCPNAKYPHLSFMVGVHPKHYCLPCCNKRTPSAESDKRARINNICLAKHVYVEEQSDRDGPRHIMSYGKEIDAGRLSAVPEVVARMFPSGELVYCLLGVPQHLPGVPFCGFIYAIAEALESDVATIMSNIIIDLMQHRDMFAALMNGGLYEYFASVDDLCQIIRELFIEGALFTRETVRFTLWTELLSEILYERGIGVIVLIDDAITKTPNVDLFVPTANERMQSNIIVLKRANVVHPMFRLDPKNYYINAAVETRIFDGSDAAIDIIMKIAGSVELPAQRCVDVAFLRALPGWKIVMKMINLQNQCYAAIIARDEGARARVYVPIEYSHRYNDGIEVATKSYRKMTMDNDFSIAAALEFITCANDQITTTNAQYFPIIVDGLMSAGGRVFGLLIGGSTQFIMDVEGARPDTTINGALVNTVEVGYDYSVVNDLIWNRAEPVADARTKQIGESLYTNYLYQLFLVEFINYIDRERDTATRAKIAKLIGETNFKKNMDEFRGALKPMIASADYTLIQSLVSTFYQTNQTKAKLLEQINDCVFEFDRTTITRLRKMTPGAMREELTTIAQKFTVQQDITGEITFPNIYMPCSDIVEKTGYCSTNKRLIVPAIAPLVDVLAGDLMNNLKMRYILNSIWMNIITDYFKFMQRPFEKITIYLLDRVRSAQQ